MNKNYKCKKCNWEGGFSQLEFDEVEGCFGDDTIEMCPNCGSYEVFEFLRYDTQIGENSIEP